MKNYHIQKQNMIMTLFTTLTLLFLTGYTLNFDYLKFMNICLTLDINDISLSNIMSIFMNYPWIIYILACHIFSLALLKNFMSKHKNLYNIYKNIAKFIKNKNKNYTLIFLFLLLAIILGALRLVIKPFIILYYFNNISFLSLLIVTILLLPLNSYIINIVIKLIINKKIKRQDLKFFNETVVNTTNLFIIIIVTIFLYVSINIDFGCIFSWIYPLIIGNYSFKSAFLGLADVRKDEWIEGWKSTSDIYKPDRGHLDYETKNYSYYDLRYDNIVITKVFPENEVWIKEVKKSNVWTKIVEHDKHKLDNSFVLPQLTISNNSGLNLAFWLFKPFSQENGKCSMTLAINDESYTAKQNQEWSISTIPESDIQQFIQFLIDNLGVDPMIAMYDVFEINVLTPFIINNLGNELVKFGSMNNYTQNITFKEPKSCNGKVNSLLTYRLKPKNIEQVFTSEHKEYFSNKKHILDTLWSNEDIINEIYASNEYFTSCVWYNPATKNLFVYITKNNKEFAILPFIPSYVQTDQGISDNLKIFKNLGIKLPIPENNSVKRINIFTQAELAKWYGDNAFLKVWRPSVYYTNIQVSNKTIIHVPEDISTIYNAVEGKDTQFFKKLQEVYNIRRERETVSIEKDPINFVMDTFVTGFSTDTRFAWKYYNYWGSYNIGLLRTDYEFGFNKEYSHKISMCNIQTDNILEIKESLDEIVRGESINRNLLGIIKKGPNLDTVLIDRNHFLIIDGINVEIFDVPTIPSESAKIDGLHAVEDITRSYDDNSGIYSLIRIDTTMETLSENINNPCAYQQLINLTEPKGQEMFVAYINHIYYHASYKKMEKFFILLDKNGNIIN